MTQLMRPYLSRQLPTSLFRRSPDCCHSLGKKLTSVPGLPHALKEWFEKLIWQPLSQFLAQFHRRAESHQTVVIVIGACINLNEVEAESRMEANATSC